MSDSERKRIPLRGTEKRFKVGGRTVASVTETHFVFADLSRPVRQSLQKSSVPEEHYEGALQVLSVAYHGVLANWTSERVGDTPDLPYTLPGPVDIDQTVSGLKEGDVKVEDLVELSRRLFGKTDTVSEIYTSMERELELIFNPPEKDK